MIVPSNSAPRKPPSRAPGQPPGTRYAQDTGLLLDEPVVILTAARAGSTLLRFLLDAHPALACPPETNLVKTAVQLAATWRMLDAAEDGLPGEAVAAIRQALDAMLARYLHRRGKQRWCDKSLGTVECAEAFMTLYPRVKFLCLHRHCMDVIASGIEACPWGVAGYGFDPYVSNSPGNNAAALAHYWADHTAAALAFEEAYPASCLRVHYEDLAIHPEETAGKIFSFLGIAPVAGIAGRCFTADHDRAGPADYKIWATGKIGTDSVGRGVTVPAGVIPAPLRAAVNELLGKLGYAQVDEGWNERDSGLPLLPRPVPVDPVAAGAQDGDPELDELGELLTGRIKASLVTGLPDGWPRLAGSPSAQPGRITITAYSTNGHRHQRSWHVDLEQAAITRSPDPGQGTGWLVIGDSQAWLSVLTGKRNLGVALRRGDLRYARPAERLAEDTGPAESADPREDVRVHVIAGLLGLT
ncbi:MAG: sulfotransferase [Streptosporangiaceae bacterium]|nr:sulfotransferase [Streptosporangiaceae bacterium]MBV9855073.1 sulfotransferase [Streptosporangiaceae bacterium]